MNKENLATYKHPVLIWIITLVMFYYIFELYRDEPLWNKLSQSGLVISEEKWGKNAALINIKNILIELNFKFDHDFKSVNLFK